MYGLKYSARAMAAVTAQRDQSQWLVGTTALREENEVHRITLLSDHSGDNLVCNEVSQSNLSLSLTSKSTNADPFIFACSLHVLDFPAQVRSLGYRAITCARECVLHRLQHRWD